MTWVLFLSLDFKDNIAQVLHLFVEVGIHIGEPGGGCDYALLWSNHFHVCISEFLALTDANKSRVSENSTGMVKKLEEEL